jgi:hypothetical protein
MRYWERRSTFEVQVVSTFALVLLAAHTHAGHESPLTQKCSPIGKRYVSANAL